MITLPRMFQVLVVENVDENQLATAAWALAIAWMATLPEPETTTRWPSKEVPRVFSISCAKITVSWVVTPSK